jgi:hypothetical protein
VGVPVEQGLVRLFLRRQDGGYIFQPLDRSQLPYTSGKKKERATGQSIFVFLDDLPGHGLSKVTCELLGADGFRSSTGSSKIIDEVDYRAGLGLELSDSPTTHLKGKVLSLRILVERRPTQGARVRLRFVQKEPKWEALSEEYSLVANVKNSPETLPKENSGLDLEQSDSMDVDDNFTDRRFKPSNFDNSIFPHYCR